MPVSRASAPLPPRARLVAAKRVVLKVGTNVLMRDDGRLALGRLSAVVESVANLAAQKREVLLVTSGAVGLGDGVAAAQRAAYALVDRIRWDGMQYRRDIGWRAL